MVISGRLIVHAPAAEAEQEQAARLAKEEAARVEARRAKDQERDAERSARKKAKSVKKKAESVKKWLQAARQISASVLELVYLRCVRIYSGVRASIV